MPFTKYNIEWKDEANELSIELKCFRHYGEGSYTDTGLERWQHLKNCIALLWPEDHKISPYLVHGWTDYRLKAFCADKFQTWWGPSSVGKTTDAAVIAIVYWLAAPRRTTVRCCSTTLPMLDQRIWGEILRYWKGVGNLPGVHFKRERKILFDKWHERSGIFGIPVKKGTTEDAVGEIIGVHNAYNLLIIDEMQITRQAAVDAFDNMSTGKEAKFLGMGNPWSKGDPLGKASKPVAGWDSISVTDTSWKTGKGHTHFFDGRKSPGVADPKKFVFFLCQADIDEMLEDPGPDSPRFHSQRIGFMPPDNVSESILSEALIGQFNVRKDVIWFERPLMFAGLDPAFTVSGDCAILIFMAVGLNNSGQQVIYEDEVMELNYKLGKGNRSFEYKLADEVIMACKKKKVLPNRCGIDVTAQQTAMASIIDEEWGGRIWRCQFGGSVQKEDLKDVYKNRVTELYYLYRDFVTANMIRGATEGVLKDFTERRLLVEDKKMQLEPKKEMKMRVGRSPDQGDAAVICTGCMNSVANITPHDNKTTTSKTRRKTNKELDIDSYEDNYMEQSL